MSVVFAFCGPIGSGKSQVSRAFAARLGVGWSSFGNAVRQIVSERGLPLTRTTLQQMGATLVQDHPEDLCSQVLKEAKSASASMSVIDGLRHVKILEQLRVMVTPRSVACVFIAAPIDLRLKRILERDGASAAQLMELEKHSTEVEVQAVLKRHADIVVTNSSSIDNCVDQIVSWALHIK